MVWSLALCPDDTKQDSVVYGAEFGVVFPAKGPLNMSSTVVLEARIYGVRVIALSSSPMNLI